jgi:hypothetical protein
VQGDCDTASDGCVGLLLLSVVVLVAGNNVRVPVAALGMVLRFTMLVVEEAVDFVPELDMEEVVPDGVAEQVVEEAVPGSTAEEVVLGSVAEEFVPGGTAVEVVLGGTAVEVEVGGAAEVKLGSVAEVEPGGMAEEAMLDNVAEEVEDPKTLTT